MADVKWIHLQSDIFDNRKIKLIEKMPEGDTIVVIWMKILCLAGQTNDNGNVYLTPEIPYTDEMLATVIDRPISTVRLALDTFEKLGMIKVIDNFIYLPSWEKYQNVEGLEKIREQTRKRVANYRERQKQIQASNDVTLHVTQCNAPDKNREDIDKNNIYTPSFQTPVLEELFLKFWKAYPKKVGKQDALKAFKKIKPTEELVDQMVNVIYDAKNTEQWTKNNGQYIPNPSTWLNQGRWEDDISTYSRKTTAEGRTIEEDRFANIDF